MQEKTHKTTDKQHLGPSDTGRLKSPTTDELRSMEKSVGITLEHLSALFILNAVKGFGPQKFKEVNELGIEPVHVVEGRAALPTKGKRGDEFRKQLDQLGQEKRELARNRAVRQIEAAFKNRAHIISYKHPSYPPLVYRSNDAVPVLNVRGNIQLLTERRAVACVGSRKIRTPYTEAHKEFAKTACSLGFAIVSGFATGADRIGHEAAFEATGQTICVMPCGLERPFPPENRDLWNRLLGYQGAVFVSEFPFGTKASALTLRKRNKLIVAFSLGVLVSQSEASGGAMNAYRFAVEQRKPIATFEPDGSPDSSGNEQIRKTDARQPMQKNLGSATPGTVKVFPSASNNRHEIELWLRELSSSI